MFVFKTASMIIGKSHPQLGFECENRVQHHPYRYNCDLQYIEKQSTLLDFKLLLLTIKIMFVPESSEGFSEAQSEQISQEARKVDEILTEDTEKKQ